MNYFDNPKVDVVDLMHGYLKKSDWQVKQNANISYSFMGLTDYLSESVIKRYAINHLLPKDAAKAHDKGEIYIHDLGKSVVGYCAGWDYRKILMTGFQGVADKTSVGPAKHLQSALDHGSRFILIVCNEWAGAQALSSVDTFMAPFIEEDRLTFQEVKNCVQRFIYNLNIATRYGGQVPFSNISLDWTVPEDLKNEPVIIGGKTIDHTYGEYQREMDMFNKALLEVLLEGDLSGQPFSFPIPTYNLTKDFNWDGENAALLFEMTAKYGLPYFQNFINSDLNPGDVRAMCCRLQMDMTQLVKKTGGRWASGASTGSIGVVDVNLPRAAYEANQTEDPDKKFFDLIDERMTLGKEVLELKRKQITQNMEEGLMPYTKAYLGTFDRHFATIGLIGMQEALQNLGKPDLTTKEGVEFAQKTIRHMLDQLLKFQKETDSLYNLEATPNESACYSLAKKDIEIYPKIITSGNGEPYYTNSAQLPVDFTEDLFEALDLQDEIQASFTGGTVFHAFLGEKLDSGEQCKKLVKKIASEYKLPYFSISPTFSICEDHGYIKGEAKSCPHQTDDGKKCKKIPLIYSRVVGYYRPVQQWNNGKTSEYKLRKEFKV